jgi:membrane-anchored protein YejM (alkaline phosphatase superfamily)
VTTAPEAPGKPGRGTLLRWIGWFGIANAALYGLVGLRYLLAFGMPDSGLATVYVGLAFIGQFALLGWLPLMLLLAPLALLLPYKRLLTAVGVPVAAASLTILMLDTNVFAEYRYHMSALTAQIFETSTWVFAGIIFCVALLFETLLAGNVWQRVSTSKGGKGKWLATVLVLCWCGGQGIHIWADATAYTPVLGFTRYMPVYFPMKATRRLAKMGLIDPAVVEQARLLRKAGTQDSGQLRYPLNPLACTADSAGLPNILFVVIDALRPDRINPENTPYIATFAAQALEFRDHYSGGNSSRMGFFSMFYGLPSTYWQAFNDTQRQPVLMDQLAARGYEITGFSSVGFGSPSRIDRTLFAAVGPKSLYTAAHEGDRNVDVTHAWRRWFDARTAPEQPWFSLLYYDPGNAASETGESTAAPRTLAEREAAYMHGINATDHEMQQVLATLDAKQDQRPTLVILASDHGYEFDELGLGNIGHGSNYGPWQLRSTLIMRWPGREPKVYTHRSAHQDLAGTLLQEVFGCSNPASDYSSGSNLFDEQSWDWMIAGSYNSHAIVEPDKLIVSYPGGLVEVLGPDYRPKAGLKPDPARIEETLLEMRRFYR